MNRNRVGVILWISLLVIAVMFAFTGFRSLTDPIGTRFDLQGNPLETGSKLSLALPLGALFLALEGLVLGLSVGIKKIPDGMINVADREYWFETFDRRERLYKNIQSLLIALGLLITIIFIAILNLIFKSNGSPISANINAKTTLIASATLVMAFIPWSLRLMRKPRDK